MVVNQDRYGNPGNLQERLLRVRKEYSQATLREEDCRADPIEQFKRWLDDAIRAELTEPNAMVLATVGDQERPSARAVLVKEVRGEGLVFYSSYQSRKGQQIEKNKFVAATFVWEELERQVRFEGVAERLSRPENESYFSTRPRGAQLAALASVQSSLLKSRAELETRCQELEQKYQGKEIPCPLHWGGYLLRPDRVEFWQGRASRLHDRVVYSRDAKGWIRQRLSP